MIYFEPHPTDPDKLVIRTQKYHIAKYTEEELQAAVLAEREACAEIAYSMAYSEDEAEEIAKAIRARMR